MTKVKVFVYGRRQRQRQQQRQRRRGYDNSSPDFRHGELKIENAWPNQRSKIRTLLFNNKYTKVAKTWTDWNVYSQGHYVQQLWTSGRIWGPNDYLHLPKHTIIERVIRQ